VHSFEVFQHLYDEDCLQPITSETTVLVSKGKNISTARNKNNKIFGVCSGKLKKLKIISSNVSNY
jgi:hypothetical protein